MNYSAVRNFSYIPHRSAIETNANTIQLNEIQCREHCGFTNIFHDTMQCLLGHPYYLNKYNPTFCGSFTMASTISFANGTTLELFVETMRAPVGFDLDWLPIMSTKNFS